MKLALPGPLIANSAKNIAYIDLRLAQPRAQMFQRFGRNIGKATAGVLPRALRRALDSMPPRTRDLASQDEGLAMRMAPARRLGNDAARGVIEFAKAAITQSLSAATPPSRFSPNCAAGPRLCP